MANFRVIWSSNMDSYTFPISGIHELTPYLFFTRLINHKFRTEHGYEDWLNNMEKQKGRFLRVQYLDQEDELIDLGAAHGEFESFKSCVFAITKKNLLVQIFVSFEVKAASNEKNDLFSKIMKMDKKEKPVKDAMPSEKIDNSLTSNKLTKSSSTECEVPDWLKSYLNQFKGNFMNEVLEKVKSTIGTSEKLTENNKSTKLKACSEFREELYDFFRESFFVLTNTSPQEAIRDFGGFYYVSNSPYNNFVYEDSSVSINFAFIFECDKLFDSQIMPCVSTRNSKTNLSVILKSNCVKNIRGYRFIIYTLECSADDELGSYYQQVDIFIGSSTKSLRRSIRHKICVLNRNLDPSVHKDVIKVTMDDLNKLTFDDKKLIALVDDDDKLNEAVNNDGKKERGDAEYYSDLESWSSDSILNDSFDLGDVNSVELLQLPRCFSAHKYSHEEMLPVFVKKNETVEENPSINLVEKSSDDVESNGLVDVNEQETNGNELKTTDNIWTDVENCFGSTENATSSHCSPNPMNDTKSLADESNPENLNEFIDKSIPILPESVINVASTVIGNMLKSIKIPQREEASKDVQQKLTPPDLVESKDKTTIDHCLEMIIQNNLTVVCNNNDPLLPSLESRISDYLIELLTIPNTKLSQDKKKLISFVAMYFANEERNSKSKIVFPDFLLKEVIRLVKFNLCNPKYSLPSSM